MLFFLSVQAPGASFSEKDFAMAGNTVFDLSLILATVADDREIAAQVIGVFLTDIPKQLDDLDAALAAGDAPTSQRVAHSIKGAAATVGAEELRAAAFEGEKMGRDGQLDELKELVPSLREKFGQAAQAMRDEGFEPMD